MRTNSMVNPVGMDAEKIEFSWNLENYSLSGEQRAYRIIVYNDKETVWDSGKVNSSQSVGVIYNGKKLKVCTRYYWYVNIFGSDGTQATTEVAFFEMGLMGNDRSVWDGAEWICADENLSNPMSLQTYSFECDFVIKYGHKSSIVLSARNKDNYILFETDIKKCTLTVIEYCDNAWSTGKPYKRICGQSTINNKNIHEKNHIKIDVYHRRVTVMFNGECIINNIDIMPESEPFKPQKSSLMLVGFNQMNGSVLYNNITVKNTDNDRVYCSFNDSNRISPLAALGECTDGGLIVNNRFEITSTVHSPIFKRVFILDKKVIKARLYATARGFYTVKINGKKTDERFYAPGFTDYRIHIDYQTYDVTNMLNTGSNEIAVTVGRGYYSGFAGYNSNADIYGKTSAFLGKLVVEFEDGSSQIIVTNESWTCSDEGPVLESDYLQGETYDARLKDIHYRKCKILNEDKEPMPTNGKLDGLKLELIGNPLSCADKVMEIDGKYLGEYPKSHKIYDLGQNIVGTVKLKCRGPRDISLKIRYGEMLNKDRSIYVANLRSAANTDVYVFEGDENGEIYMPIFSSHGFRYVEITGNGTTLHESDIEIISVTGVVISGINTKTGYFECSNEMINKLQSNIEWGQRGNYLLVPTDCPQRNERMGWTGDAQVFGRTAAFNMDVFAFTAKWLHDLRDAQLMYNRGGAVPDTAPLCGDNRPMGGCGGWGDAAVIVPWEMYMAYGNISVLEDNYEMMKAWVDYQNSEERRNNGIRTVDGKKVFDMSDISETGYIQVQQSRGDHLAYDKSTPFIYCATAYAAYSALLLSKIAGVLSKEDDKKKYFKIFEKIKKSFNEAWVNDDGTISYWGEMSFDGIKNTYYCENQKNHPSQTAYALAIDFDLIEVTPKTVECFARSIKENDGCISVGFLGVSHIVPALMKSGLVDLAYELMEQEKNPSWLYSVKNGATTIWERWNSYNAQTGEFGDASMNSFNHYAYGAVGECFYRYILGINPLEAGYKKILLNPVIGGSLSYAKGYHITPYGKVVLEWKKYNNTIRCFCRIPANTSAIMKIKNNMIFVRGKNYVIHENYIELSCGEYEFDWEV